MSQIKKKFIGADQVSGDKILLDNAQGIRSKKFNSAQVVEVIKLNAEDKLELVQPPVIRTGPSTTVEVADKPYVTQAISDLNVSALEGRVSDIENAKGQANGYASLGSDGKLPSAQIPSLAISDVYVVDTMLERNTLHLPPQSKNINVGDVVKVLNTDQSPALPRTYICNQLGTIGEPLYVEIESGSDVDSVNGQTGNVVLTTDNIAEGTSNKYYTDARFDTRLANKTTDNLVEGSNNFYYSDARFSGTLATKTTDNLNEGGVNLYYTNDRFDARLSEKNTNNLNEGANLYFTEERARAAAVADSISDAVTNIAPSQNAVYDALALKLNTAGGSVSGDITMTGGATVKGLPAAPSDDGEAASKKYVDDQIDAIPAADLSSYATKSAVNAIVIPVLSYDAIELTSGQASAKQVTLTATPSANSPVMISVDGIMLRPRTIVNGSPVGDFTRSGAVVDFTNCVPALEAGDLLQIYYMVDTNPAI